uniref:Putative transcription factor gt-2 n=2 Tax=Nyssomyia neivai TaxID=330878 RepID=A0A1L8DG88_9DIPT
MADGNRKRTEWTIPDTTLLISVWRENIDDLRRQKRHKTVMLNMKHELQALGVRKTEQEIASKIKNMTAKYRDEKKKMGTGSSPSDWAFFAQVNEFLGSLPANDDSLVDEGLVGRRSSTLNDSAGEPSGSSTASAAVSGDDSSNSGDSTLPMTRYTKKRKNAGVQLEMLEETKKANKSSELFQTELLKNLKEANEIAKLQATATQALADILRNAPPQ